MESVHVTIQSAHTQCSAGKQSISEIDAAETLADWGLNGLLSRCP